MFEFRKSWSFKMTAALSGIFVGIFIAIGTELFLAESSMPSWIYQLLLGAYVFSSGVGHLNVQDDNPSLIPSWAYGSFGILNMVVGLTVFLNFGRYDEIYALTGAWPLILLGGLIFVAEFLTAIHYLTAYERSLPSTRGGDAVQL